MIRVCFTLRSPQKIHIIFPCIKFCGSFLSLFLHFPENYVLRYVIFVYFSRQYMCTSEKGRLHCLKKEIELPDSLTQILNCPTKNACTAASFFSKLLYDDKITSVSVAGQNNTKNCKFCIVRSVAAACKITVECVAGFSSRNNYF